MMRPSHAVLLLAAWSAPSIAQQDAVVPRDGAPVAATLPAWIRFQDEVPGRWRVEWWPATGTPAAIYGTGIPIADWRENTLAEARRHALQLLTARAELLGLGTSEFRESIGARMGRSWSFTFDQYFRGLPVVGGRADVRIHIGGRIALFGSLAVPIPADFGIVPAIDGLTATAAAWLALGHQPRPERVAPPARLVVWSDLQAPTLATPNLAWEVVVEALGADGRGPMGRYYIDALRGTVLHYTSDKHECGTPNCRHREPVGTIVGAEAVSARPTNAAAGLSAPVPTSCTVMGFVRTGPHSTSAVVNVPMPGLQVSIGGQPHYTDENGQVTVDIAAPTFASVDLRGRHHALIAGATPPTASATLVPGVAGTLQLLTAGANDVELAHTNTSWWIHRANEFCRGILGNTAQMAAIDAIQPYVNLSNLCNASYGNNTVYFYNAFNGCANTAFGSVIAHEWGHGLDDRYGGISSWNGLGEGWADVVAMYLTDQPEIGTGLTGPIPLRAGTNTQQFQGNANGGNNFHAQGMSFMGFAWKVRENLAQNYQSRAIAAQITNDIVLGSIVANAWNQPRAVLEIYVADDDDGNLANGTPTSPALDWACAQHSLPTPGVLPRNDECSAAITVFDGLNGPYDSRFATAAGSPAGAAVGADLWFRYTTGVAGPLTFSVCGQAAFDTLIEVYTGPCGALTLLAVADDVCGVQSAVTIQATPGTYVVRVGGKLTPVPYQNQTIGYVYDTGVFSLSVQGPGAGTASATPFGSGCGAMSGAFYETFLTGAFDLSGTAVRAVRSGAYYRIDGQGSFVAPSPNATVLPLGDDTEVQVVLSQPLDLPHPPFVTHVLNVCSNGFVSVYAGNTTNWQVNVAEWLASPVPRFGMWYDFRPDAPGSGQVKFEEIGGIAYVTWDGVHAWNASVPHTWQLQFDCNTGNVTMAFAGMPVLGGPALVGRAGVGPNVDDGSSDLSARTGAGFTVAGVQLATPTMTADPPRFGGVSQLRTVGYPVGSFGIVGLGIVGYWPGIPLDVYGATGCVQYTALESTTVVIPSLGASSYALAVPHLAAFQGLPVHAQTFILSAGANPAGVIASNAVGMYVGS